MTVLDAYAEEIYFSLRLHNFTHEDELTKSIIPYSIRLYEKIFFFYMKVSI